MEELKDEPWSPTLRGSENLCGDTGFHLGDQVTPKGFCVGHESLSVGILEMEVVEEICVVCVPHPTVRVLSRDAVSCGGEGNLFRDGRWFCRNRE